MHNQNHWHGGVLVVDTNNLVMRNFHALPWMTADDGTPTNAVFGTIRAIRQAIITFRPSRVFICWDDPTRNYWRRDVFPDYKAKRRVPTAHREIGAHINGRSVFEVQTDLLQGIFYLVLKLPQLRVPRLEADDLLAIVAGWCRPYPTVLLSADHDFNQLVCDDVSIFDPMKEEWRKPENFEQCTGVPTPSLYLDRMIINGDSGDGVPMVKGLSGEKRWESYVSLLRQTSLRSCLAGRDFAKSLEKAKWPEDLAAKFAPRFEELERNLRLVDLRYAAERVKGSVETDLLLSRLDGFDPQAVWDMAVKLSMRSITSNFEEWVRPFVLYHQEV